MASPSSSASRGWPINAFTHLTTREVCVVDDAEHPAEALAHRLNIPLCRSPQPTTDQWLQWIETQSEESAALTLCSKHHAPVSIDFLHGKKAHRRQFGGGKGQPLVRAMGKTEQGYPKVLDATAGMGGDSYVLASLGFEVTMVERSPIVAALLEDALHRARHAISPQPEAVQASLHRLHLIQADTADYLLSARPDVDVIYLDPMYPQKRKKAAAKKEMQALQHLVGPDVDSTRVLDAALQTATTRVVVKRPKGAPPLQSQQFKVSPSTQITSPNTRYDIYVIKALKASGRI